MRAENEKSRRMRAAAIPQNDRAASGSDSIVEPQPVAVVDIPGTLAIVVRTSTGRRTLTRTFHSAAAARRAADRAQERGDRVAVVLVRLVPIASVRDPLQLHLVEDLDQAAGGAA